MTMEARSGTPAPKDDPDDVQASIDGYMRDAVAASIDRLTTAMRWASINRNVTDQNLETLQEARDLIAKFHQSDSSGNEIVARPGR